MALVLCRDLGAADWITGSTLPWQQLVCFGPAGFDAYARLRLLPDPVGPGQSENDVATYGPRGGLRRLLEVLAGHTFTADDCYACVWEGFGVSPQGSDRVARVVVPHRAYWLLRGPLADLGSWEAAEGWPGLDRLGSADPAFVWPADRAWCVARDVDPHWAGIGCTRAVADLLVGDPTLDVVPADPSQEQPAYR